MTCELLIVQRHEDGPAKETIRFLCQTERAIVEFLVARENRTSSDLKRGDLLRSEHVPLRVPSTMDALRTAFDPLELSSRSPSARIQRLSSPPSCSPSSILDTAVYSVSSDFAKLTAMSTFTLKTRHYAALSSRLRNLGQNLSDTEHQLGALAEHLQAMSKLGVNCGAQ